MRPEQSEFFERFYRDHFDELVIYANTFLHNSDHAKIATQDAFHTAVRKIDDFMDSPNPIGWMKKTVKNTVRNMIRARERQIKMVISLEELPVEPSSTDKYDIMPSVLDECGRVLSKEEVYLLRRIAIDGVTYVEMSDELGISVWACRKRVQRMMDRLRKDWKPDAP